MEEDGLYRQQQSEVSPSKRYLEHDVFSLLAFLGKSSNQEWKAFRVLFPEEFQQGKVITQVGKLYHNLQLWTSLATNFLALVLGAIWNYNNLE